MTRDLALWEPGPEAPADSRERNKELSGPGAWVQDDGEVAILMTIIIEPPVTTVCYGSDTKMCALQTPDGTQNLPRHTKTVLLGEVQDGRASQSRTRYETERVLHAAGTAGKPISFKSLFERVEAADEEASARADTLQTLYAGRAS